MPTENGAAVEEGVEAGGGVAFLRARVGVTVKGNNHDAGIKIVLRAIEQPMREIVANAGDEPSVVVNKVPEGKGNFGYNAASVAGLMLIPLELIDRLAALIPPPCRYRHRYYYYGVLAAPAAETPPVTV